MPDTHRQLLLDIDAVDPNDPLGVAHLETHVVDGVFCPPLKDGEEEVAERRSRRARPRREPPSVVPASLLSYDPASSTYRTSARRLASRDVLCGADVVVRDEARGADAPYALARVSRSPWDWLAMHYREVGGDGRLVVLNTRARGREEDVAVVLDGVVWVAEFGFTRENRERVERAGFRFDPEERRWQTRDARVAARLDPSLRIGTQPREAGAPRRRATFGRRRLA